MNLKKMIDLYPDILAGDGLFAYMNTAPWVGYISGEDLDIQFFSEYGERPAAPLYKLLKSDYNLSSGDRERIADMVYKRFRYNWEHKFNLLTIKYDPISNFRMKTTGNVKLDYKKDQNHTIEDIVLGNNTTSKTNTGTDTEADTWKKTKDSSENISSSDNITSNITNNTDDNVTGNSDSSTYGFNSETDVPTNKQVNKSNEKITNTGESKTSNTGTSTNTGKDTTNKDGTTTRTLNLAENTTLNTDTNSNRTDIIDRTDSNVTTHDTLKEGSIGLKPTQDLIMKEIELWKWDFFKSVFDDVVSMLTLPIYEIEI